MMLIKKNLSTTDLKLIALFLMVLDHIYLFFSYSGLIPEWFTWLGRISLPLFLFCMAEGFYYTRSRKNYILRLFVAFLVMEASRWLLMASLPRPDGFFISNNIFGTMLLAVVIIYFVDQLRLHRNDIGRLILYCLLIFGMIPLTFFVEGGWFYVLLGIIFYYTRQDRLAQAIEYVFMSLFFWATQPSCQWMMVFAVFFMLLYDGRKGKGYKYLFYVFYPLHIWIFYALSVICYDALIQ